MTQPPVGLRKSCQIFSENVDIYNELILL